MPPLTTTVKVDLGRRQRRQVDIFNANPRTRAHAARIVNHGAHRVIAIAREIAEEELHNDRPKERRRHPDSPHYVDCFFVTPTTMDRINRVVAGFGNNHPAAAYIEHGGGGEHTITAVVGGENSGNLVFPFRKGASRGGPGQPPGDWPVRFGEAGSQRMSVYSVTHPGSPAFHIIRRAREAYRRQARTGASRRRRR